MQPEQLTIDQILRVAVDPCERKHKGNAQSVAAHDRVKHSKRDSYKRIMDYLKSKGTEGATSKEIAAALNKPLHCLSGRYAELKMIGWIRESGEKRNGAAVLVIV